MRTSALFAAQLLLSACGKSEQAPLDDDEIPPCWVYEGLDDEEIKRMEAWCNEYAVCSDEGDRACSGTPDDMQQ